MLVHTHTHAFIFTHWYLLASHPGVLSLWVSEDVKWKIVQPLQSGGNDRHRAHRKHMDSSKEQGKHGNRKSLWTCIRALALWGCRISLLCLHTSSVYQRTFPPCFSKAGPTVSQSRYLTVGVFFHKNLQICVCTWFEWWVGVSESEGKPWWHLKDLWINKKREDSGELPVPSNTLCGAVFDKSGW